MATEAQVNASSPSDLSETSPIAPWDTPVQVMTYNFPSMEPSRIVEYTQKQLQMPLRRDILHRAVVYEGDMTRQGTASTKWRGDVHGSHRKLMAQKGSGRARVGNKQSPIRVGGGVAHGPHPRDFSTELPQKIYDQAWRIALSYRFARGELVVIDKDLAIPRKSTPFMLERILKEQGWGNKKGRSTLITADFDEQLSDAMDKLKKFGIVRDCSEVDVKNLLETERLIIEKKALDRFLQWHSRDLTSKPAKARYLDL